MNLKKFGKIFTSKFVGTGPSPYEKIIYRAAVSQRLRNTALEQWFPKCATQIPRDPRPVPRGSVDTFL